MTLQIFKEDAYNFGFTDGISLGEIRGEHKKATETAKNLLSLGLSHKQIASATGLSIEEVEKLQEG